VSLWAYLRPGLWRRRGERGKKDRDTGYLFTIPTGDQAMPRYDPKWDPENDKDEWTPNHLINCVLESLRRAKIKHLNYSQVMSVQQGPLEAPVAFLQRLKGALQKHTNIVHFLFRKKKSS
jgi:hypothetical protein